MITYSFLQYYWWFIISLLGGLLSFFMFVQGGQTLLCSVAKTNDERRLVINVLGRKWEYTFTTLVTFGGAFFASFPLFYSTSFGGAFWVWILILFCFVIQAVSYEYMSKPNNLLGRKTYETFLFINGALGTFLIGAAVATFFTGSDFHVVKGNISDIAAPIFQPVISSWGNEWHGIDALFDVRNWLLGFGVLFLARTLGALYFVNRVKNEEVEARARKQVLYNAIPFLVFFLVFLIWTLFADGFAVDPVTKAISLEKMKYLTNFLHMPIVLVLFLLGVVGVLVGICITVFCKASKKGIWYAGVGTVLTVCCLFLIAGYNNTAFYPAYPDLQSSLTLVNASSSFFTLKVMSVVSILIPLVLAYIVIAWRAMEKKHTDIDDINSDSHAY